MERMKSLMMFVGLIFAVSMAPEVGFAGEEERPGEGLAPENAMEADAEDLAEPARPSMEAMGAEFMRKVMEMSARIEAVQKKMAEREQAIRETNPEVKAMRARMMHMQRKINRILDEDEELAELKMERDMLWTTMPSLPSPPSRQMQPGMPMQRQTFPR